MPVVRSLGSTALARSVRVTALARSVRVTALAALCLMSVSASHGFAQSTSSARDEEARNLFQAGRVAMDDARLADALGYFERAFQLSGRPEMLYNIGVTAEGLGQHARALEALERFLAELPAAPNHVEVEGRVEALRKALREAETSGAGEHAADLDAAEEVPVSPDTMPAAVEPSKPPHATPPDSEAEQPRSHTASESESTRQPPTEPARLAAADGHALSWIEQRPLTWVALGVGAISAGLSTYFWLDAKRTHTELKEGCFAEGGCTRQEIDDSGGKGRLLWSRVFMVGSLVSLAGAATLFFVEAPRDSGAEDRLAIDVGPGSLQVRGRF